MACSSDDESGCATFRIGDYLAPGDCFHLIRKQLPTVGRPHDHDCHELCWIESGRAHHRVNGEARTLSTGDLLFVRPADRHRLQSTADRSCTIVNVMFPSETVEHFGLRYGQRIGDRLFWSTGRLPAVVSLDAARRARLTRLAERLAAGERDLARLEGFLLELITRVLDDAPAMPAIVPDWLARACRDARDPAVFRRGASGFVALTGKSHEHVCRAARRYLDASPSTVVNRLRMDHAARLLSGSDRSITEIGLDCGIDNVSHFYRLFRQRFAMTPRAYRLAYRRDPV